MRVGSSIATLRENSFIHAGPLRQKWMRSVILFIISVVIVCLYSTLFYVLCFMYFCFVFYVKTARWRLFGHVLRMPRDTPAQQAIDYYFADTGDATFRGRPRTSLPTALSADLRRVGRTLRRPADIDALRLLNREQWRQLERDIAEESLTN